VEVKDMTQQSHHPIGTVLGYIATLIGAITLGLWFFFDTENANTAVLAAATVIIGVLVITLSRRSDKSNTN